MSPAILTRFLFGQFVDHLFPKDCSTLTDSILWDCSMVSIQVDAFIGKYVCAESIGPYLIA